MGMCIENLFVYIFSTCWCAHGRSANSPVRAWPARGRVRRWDKIDFPTTSPTWLWSLITPTRIYIDIVRLHRYPMYICICVQYADTARGWSWKIRLFVSARLALYKHTDGVFIARTTHTTYVRVCVWIFISYRSASCATCMRNVWQDITRITRFRKCILKSKFYFRCFNCYFMCGSHAHFIHNLILFSTNE